jgi:DNA-binding CsgD family transcriptional regulator
VSLSLIFLYLAAIVLGIFPVARISRLRKTYNQPFLSRVQAFALLISLILFSDLIIRYLGPSLNVVRLDQTVNLSMLFGLIMVPALIVLCFLFIRLVFALLQRPIPRVLAIVYAVFWGIFFIGFVYAEIQYFQTGSMAATRILETVFQAGLTAFFIGAAIFLFGRARNLADPERKALAIWLAIVYLAGFLIPIVGRVFSLGVSRRWMIFEYLFLLLFNAGVAAFIEVHLRRHAPPLGVGSGDHGAQEVFARFRITRREQDVVRGVLDGRSNAEIAAAFFISEKTVETHIYNVYQKTGVKSRIQLLNLFRGNSESSPERDRL